MTTGRTAFERAVSDYRLTDLAPPTDALAVAAASLERTGLFLLGDVLQRNGRPAEALPYLEGAQMIWGKSPPSNPKDLEKLDVAIVTTRAALRK